MKILLKIFLVLSLMISATAYAAEAPALIVIPDDVAQAQSNYYVYPEAAEIFATDIINNLNKAGLSVPSASKLNSVINNDIRVKKASIEMMKKFKYTYNIDFESLQKVANKLGTKRALLITSSIDTQNYILRRNIWDFLNIPGAMVIDPAYKLSTYFALVDTDKQMILWQKKYSRRLSTIENRIVAVNFAPATEQLEKMKFYSEYLLSPEVTQMVKFRLAPATVTSEVQGEVVSTEDMPVMSTPASNPIQGMTKELELKVKEVEIRTKPYIPRRPRQGSPASQMINDI